MNTVIVFLLFVSLAYTWVIEDNAQLGPSELDNAELVEPLVEISERARDGKKRKKNKATTTMVPAIVATEPPTTTTTEAAAATVTAPSCGSQKEKGEKKKDKKDKKKDKKKKNKNNLRE
uniref:Putative salivary mucin n=1 Tax=Ornithodoros turicata TaxID=34597 RepID=A0A2R5L3Z3_9ACAR